MPYVDWDGHITETRKERRRRERPQRMAKRLSVVRTTSLVSAISISSLLMAGFTTGTEAMLTAAASGPGIQFGAADHFPGWYTELNGQLKNTVAQENTWLLDISAIKNTHLTSSDLKTMSQDVKQLDGLEATAIQTFHVIDQAAQIDEQRYTQALNNPSISQVDVASYARVVAIGQKALNEAELLLIQAKQEDQEGSGILVAANKEYLAEQQAFDVSVISSVYGQTVIHTVYGGSSQKSSSVTSSVYGQVYGSTGNFATATLGPITLHMVQGSGK